MVKKLIVSIVLLILLINIVLALPPAPPPTPGGFEEDETEVATPAEVEEEFNEQLQEEFALATTPDAKINVLEKRIISLEEKIMEMDSEGLSTPLKMVLIINLIMLAVFIYMLMSMLKPKRVL